MSVGATTFRLRPGRLRPALHADKFLHQPGDLAVIRADVADGPPALRIGQAIEHSLAGLEAAGAERADGGEDFAHQSS